MIRLMPVESPNSLASLSPDGEKVAFTTTEDRIAVFDLTSGTQTTYPLILHWATRFDWSPDSQILLAGGIVGGPYEPSSPSGESDYPKVLYAIWIQDGRYACLGCKGTNAEKGFYGEKPAWSPNSSWIAYIARVFGSPYPYTKNLYVMDAGCIEELETCHEQAVLLDETSWLAPKWSVKSMLASSCYVGEKHGICVIDVTRSSSPRMVIDIDDLTESNEALVDFDWSPDGENLAITVRYGKVAAEPFPEDAYSDVWVIPAQGGEVYNLINTPYVDEWLNEWSPDGEYITFSRGSSLEELPKWEGAFVYVKDIYIVPATGGEAINITNTPDEREEFAFWMVIPNQFRPGSMYQITPAGNDLNIRSSPSLGSPAIGKLKTGDTVTILEGPVEADGYTWWKMRTEDGVEGWAVDVAGWYAPVEATLTPTLTPAP